MKTTLLSIGILLLLRNVAGANSGYSGDHISIDFYIAGENADKAKDNLIALLDMDRYPYKTQANLSHNLVSIPPYLDAACNASSLFAALAEDFFNLAKNESANLLMKLRQVPSTQSISDRIKSQLEDYFTEMENFHFILCAVLDDAMEFTLDSVRVAQRTFTQYIDVHNDIEQRRHQPNECSFASDYLWKSADEIFKCATGKLRVTYDIYSITKMTTYHVMKMLEHRIQKLYNCFVFGNYPIRCRFVRNAEADFVKLHARLDDLMMYNDKQRRKIFRKRGGFLKCIPKNFPDSQMLDSLRLCLLYG